MFSCCRANSTKTVKPKKKDKKKAKNDHDNDDTDDVNNEQEQQEPQQLENDKKIKKLQIPTITIENGKQLNGDIESATTLEVATVLENASKTLPNESESEKDATTVIANDVSMAAAGEDDDETVNSSSKPSSYNEIGI